MAIEIRHDFVPSSFKWLWAKYVRAVNDKEHCTNCLRGPYSKIFSKLNPQLPLVVRFNECPETQHKAVYICGVVSRGYAKHLNYPHNVHLAIEPASDHCDYWEFEDWHVEVKNGRVLTIPPEEQLPLRYKGLPQPYVSCRIFRWAVCWAERAPTPDTNGSSA